MEVNPWIIPGDLAVTLIGLYTGLGDVNREIFHFSKYLYK